MNIIFMGSPDFAVPSLQKLIEAEFVNIKGVVTQPDRKRGRGQKIHPTPIKEKALEYNLEILQPETINKPEIIDTIRAMKPEVLVVVAFGQKLSSEILEIPDKGCINLHASLLPEYRGASPIHKAIIDGKKETGVTTMFMDEGWDSGDIIEKKKIKISEDDNAGTLHDRLAAVGAQLLLETLSRIDGGLVVRKKQDEEQTTYAYKMEKSDGEINWNLSAIDVYNLIRGVTPWPGAYTYLDHKILKIWESETGEGTKQPAKPGTVVEASPDKGLIIQCGQGLLKVKKLQLEGRQKMQTEDFLRGHEIKEGTLLG